MKMFFLLFSLLLYGNAGAATLHTPHEYVLLAENQVSGGNTEESGVKREEVPAAETHKSTVNEGTSEDSFDNVNASNSSQEEIVAIFERLSRVECICLSGTVVSLFFSFVLLNCLISLRKQFRKLEESSDNLGDRMKRLNEKVLTSFTTYVQELSKSASSVTAQNTQTTSAADLEVQHSLIKNLAGRIVFMEVTMSKMDSSVRGYKQLNKSLSQMKEHLKGCGYEIIDMLGKPYNSGMKLVANFIDDENLEKGVQIITSVIKPQINFNGVMIQSAQITVTQNI